MHPVKAAEGIMEAAMKADAVFGGVLEGNLEVAEEATSTGYGQGHGAKLPEELVPVLRRHALLCARNGGKIGGQALGRAVRESDGHGNGVNGPF